jgi:hypothetical protein
MKKILTSIILMLALVAMTAGTAFAQEATEIAGTVQTVEFETNAETGETVVVVSLLDALGATQTIKLSLETAASLGLITTDPISGESTVAEGAIGSEVVIDPAVVIPDEVVEEEEAQHPVGSALSEFFSTLFGVDYDTIMEQHENGVGFGVIAQALHLTSQVEGDTATFVALIEAKQSGDYSAITLADGSTPDNWGDVVKSLKKGSNLGSVMSGKADSGDDETALETETGNGNNGNGKGNNKDKGNNGKGKNK